MASYCQAKSCFALTGLILQVSLLIDTEISAKLVSEVLNRQHICYTKSPENRNLTGLEISIERCKIDINLLVDI